jgi:hypothetical protein
LKHDLANAARAYMALGLSVAPFPDGVTFGPERIEDVGVLVHDFSPPTTGIDLLLPATRIVVQITGDAGAQQWLDIFGPPDSTWTAKTPTGLHLYYATVLSLEGTFDLPEAPDIAVLTSGVRIPAPPTRGYTWLLSAKDTPLMELPNDLHAALMEHR